MTVHHSTLRVACHAINGIGLGHLVRMTCLAEEIRSLIPGAALLIVTNARDPQLVVERSTTPRLGPPDRGIDYVQLPPRLDEPHADPARIREALAPPHEHAALIAIFEAFAPHLVIFDTHAPPRVVRALAERGIRSTLVLRELRPEVVRGLVGSGSLLAFDRIVVPHEPDEFDTSPLADLPVDVVGPVIRSVARAAPRERPLVVAFAGGGGQPIDARRYTRAVADAHWLARARIPDLETVLVVGPYGEPPTHIDGYHGLEVVTSVQDPSALMSRAHLVISQAGYNAIGELRSVGQAAVVVPAYRKAEDQRARAHRLAAIGAAVIERADARRLADRIEQLVLDPAALAAMRAAHARWPLVPANRRAALSAIRPVWRPPSRVERIALIAHDFPPRVGGMESVAASLARELAARQFTVKVYTANRLGARNAGGEPLYTNRRAPATIDLWRDLAITIDHALRDDPDVIHLCHAGLAPWLPALRAALPCIVTCHVHGNDLIAPWVHHEMTGDDYRAAQVAGLSAADAVFCVSQFSLDRARALGVAPGVLEVVANGVDTSRFSPADPAGRADRADRAGATGELILTVARLAPRKGHRTVLRALAELAPRWPHLRYAFTGVGELRDQLLALAGELSIADRVDSLGIVDERDLPALYRRASLFALVVDDVADDVEGFGVALAEAAASGVAVIASRCGGIPEALGDCGVLVPPGDHRATAQAIERVLADRGYRDQLASRGRARACAQLSLDRAVDRIVTRWNELAIRGPRHAIATASQLAQIRQAQHAGTARRSERAHRRDALARAAMRDRGVRLRATGDGARLLADTLDDCAAVGVRPDLELKLRKFVSRDVIEHVLPQVGAIDLVHGVPDPAAAALIARLGELASESLARVRVLRLFATSDAPLAPAVTEAYTLRKLFVHHGAVVVPPPDLMHYLSELPARGPITAMIEPTNLCNLTCPTCPTGTGKIPPLPAMPLARFDHALGELGDQVANLALWNYGEPLLNRELPAMIASAKRAGVGVVKVSSNVHFLDGERGLALLQSGLDVLILSVDGASAQTYATFRKDGDFDRVARAVAWLCSEKRRLGLARPRIELQFIAMSHNEHELPAIRELATAWGVDALRVKTVGADDPATKHLIPASRLLSRYQADGTTPTVRHPLCTMAWDHTVVNVDGSVTPCCYLRPDMGDQFVMGNLFETSFRAIWRGERYRRFRAAMLAGREAMPVCASCRGGTHDLLAMVEEVAR